MHKLTNPSPAVGSNRIYAARRIDWTKQADDRLARLRAKGASLNAIAVAFGLGRRAIEQRAAHLGVSFAHSAGAGVGGQGAGASCSSRLPSQAPSHDLLREPLPAGHAITWGLLTAGTCLDGAAYVTPDASRLRVRRGQAVFGQPE